MRDLAFHPRLMKPLVIHLIVLTVIAALPLAAAEYQTTEEYGIYSIVLEKLYVDSQTQLVVIGNKTTAGFLPRLPVWGDLAAEIERNKKDKDLINHNRVLEKMSPAVWADFKSQNDLSTTVEVTGIRLSIRTVTPGVAKPSEGDIVDYWTSFYRRFPGSPGLLTVSRVGFDRQTQQAVVYVGRKCGYMCGDEYLVLLSKSSGKWRIVGKYLATVS